MARGDKHFWLKVLIGLVFTMLVVDVLLLIYAVVPLAASQSKRAEPSVFSPRLTYSPAQQALILPTHDPRKPWVTRTPQPTTTPWLSRAATFAPQRQAAAGSTEGAARVPADAARADPAPESEGESESPINPTSSPSAGVGAVTVLPTSALGVPARTPSPNQLPGTDQPPSPIVPGDQAQFGTYVMAQYGTIAGQALSIAAITLDTTDAGVARAVVEVAGDDANNVFAAQTATAALDYGHRLLNDLKYYFNGQNCMVEVVNSYVTSKDDACTNNPTWCVIGPFDISTNSRTVTWIYVRGTSVDGVDSVETWNAGQ